MAFALSAHSLPGAQNYNAARALYERAEPFRTRGELPRSLEGHRALKDNRSRHLTVRMKGDNVVFRLHSTDCVTWRKDGACVVRGYPSVSTSMFLNVYTPAWATAHMISHIGEMMWVRVSDERTNGYLSGPLHGYWIDDVCTLHPDRTVEGTHPIPVPRLNLKRAAAARKASGVNDYRDWWRARQAIERGPRQVGIAANPDAILATLRDGLSEAWDRLPPPGDVLDAVYRAARCVDVEHVPYLIGWPHEKAVCAAQRKYSYYRWLT